MSTRAVSFLLASSLLGVPMAAEAVASVDASVVAPVVASPVACLAPTDDFPATAKRLRYRWGDAMERAYLDEARARTLEELKRLKISLPRDFLSWIDGDDTVRTTVYGCRNNPVPVILALRSLEIDLGESVVRKDYTQLALAFAIQDSCAPRSRNAMGWNDGDPQAKGDEASALPDVSPRPPLTLTIPGDPRTPIDTKDPARPRTLNDHIINFFEDHAPVQAEVMTKELPPLEYDDKGIAKPRGKATAVKKTVERPLVAADVIASSALQVEFNQYMRSSGHPEVQLNCGDKVVSWFSNEGVSDKAMQEGITKAYNLFHDAYRATGRMPAERDGAPSASESMAWFIRNDKQPRTPAERAVRGEDRFPLNAPWPVLMMLAADDQPLREREEIWLTFTNDAEMRTYGEYTGGIAQQSTMQAARRLSPFSFSNGSIQMMWKDGGVCGTMGNIGARTYRTCGVPSSTAGQPGHCALVRMAVDAKTGDFQCVGGQYATGGDEVTHVHAGWNYDDRGERRHMVFHQSVAWGVNQDLESYLDAMVLARAISVLSPAEQAGEAKSFAAAAIAENPFAVPAFETAVRASSDPKELIAIVDDFSASFPKAVGAERATTEFALYGSTMRDLVHARIAALPLPTGPAGADTASELLDELERQGCTNANLLAACWRAIDGEGGFSAGCCAKAKAYLESPDRTKSKAASTAFVKQVNTWAKGLKGKAAKRKWAEEMLAVFKGNESLTIKKKTAVDPVVAVLCKMAGVDLPKAG
ncbi:MAG: hypothetical protein O2819_03350 [Planctomycetota bacterium]|nr:hypothetical protein [Planctomycetota bacterium]MDA1106211.1 hypothetical protein [Planctomycetota bacterium]